VACAPAKASPLRCIGFLKVPLPFFFAQVMWVTQVLNERTIVGNGRLHLFEAQTQGVPYLTQTGHMLRKLALNLLDLPFECLDSLVCLNRKLLGRLQKQLAQLAFIQVELFYQLLVFREITSLANRRSSTIESSTTPL
jgi:hypothetical protein